VETRSPAQIAGDVLRDQREQAELTQSELARKVFCSQSLISGLGNAKKMAHSDLIRLIDDAVGARGVLIKVWPVTASGEQSAETLPTWRQQPPRFTTGTSARSLACWRHRATRERSSGRQIHGLASKRSPNWPISASRGKKS
jgi:hypothetical protein